MISPFTNTDTAKKLVFCDGAAKEGPQGSTMTSHQIQFVLHGVPIAMDEDPYAVVCVKQVTGLSSVAGELFGADVVGVDAGCFE